MVSSQTHFAPRQGSALPTLPIVIDRIPHAWLAGIRAAVIEGLPAIAVGLELGTFASPDQFGYAGQALKYCETPWEVLKLLVRCCALTDSAFREFPLSLDGGRDTVELRMPRVSTAAPDPPECTEAVFVSHVTMMRAATGEPVSPRQVVFAHARGGALRRRFEDFFGADVQFGGAHNAMVFDRSVLERPMPGADGEARRRFEAQARKLSKEPQPFAVIVAREVEVCLARGGLSQERVAKSLGLSTRSLQRQLKEDGATYGDVVAAARRSIAERLLRDPSLAIYEVALATGYDDVRCLDRFFRRHMGVTPRAYRERLPG